MIGFLRFVEFWIVRVVIRMIVMFVIKCSFCILLIDNSIVGVCF